MIAGDTASEPGDEAVTDLFDPRIEIGSNLAANHDVEAVNKFAYLDQERHARFSGGNDNDRRRGQRCLSPS